jgi:shikimate dehydrogenase
MAEPRRAFVAGHPIAHSRSPLIHGHWLSLHGLAGTYGRIDVEPARFALFLGGLEANGLAGGNVTIPHKEAAFALVERRGAAAQAIGAVNTVWLEDGQLVGDNTDAYGFAANLDAEAPGWRDADSALVLGAGGAARAIVHALKQAGIARIVIANRTEERASALADGFGVESVPWSHIADELRRADLLVNTTSLGMAGKGELAIDLASLGDTAIVTDIVYVPLETPLLAAARARGLRTVDGLGMLLHQAVPGFERWFGVRPQVDDALRSLILSDLGRSA